KMDLVGIKLQLSEWSMFSIEEKNELVLKVCGNDEEKRTYRNFLSALVLKYTGMGATPLNVEQQPLWADLENISEALQEKAMQFDWKISIEQWQGLTNLQRFALLKLCRPGHENKNFPKAMKEFNIV
ncbi:MAG: nitrate reductase associated protein, partial [Bacteroidia bacterium]|nr:nitrate reductase associated protein [Bacteroidia bacterium]